MSYQCLRTKSFEKFEKENNKGAWIGLVEKDKREKGRKTLWKSDEHMREKNLFVLCFQNSIGRAPIGYQSSQTKGKLFKNQIFRSDKISIRSIKKTILIDREPIKEKLN